MEESKSLGSFGESCFSIRKTNASISVENKLLAPNEDEYLVDETTGKASVAPYTLHSKMSRFVFTIFSNGKRISANFNAKGVDKFCEKGLWLYRNRGIKFDEYSMLSSGEGYNTGTSPAYTVPIMGKFNKRTAVQIISENPERKNELIEQINYLRDNVGKYPANQKQIDAINEAIKLFEEGKLKKGVLPKSETLTLIPPEVKYFRGKNSKNEKGYQHCYILGMKYDSLAGNTPITITIENFFAPLLKSEDGKTVIKVSKRDVSTVKKESFSLTMDELFELCNFLSGIKMYHEMVTYPRMDKVVSQYRWHPIAND